jgi:hypothetical protein
VNEPALPTDNRSIVTIHDSHQSIEHHHPKFPQSIEHHHPKFPQSIEHHHLHTIGQSPRFANESQSMFAGGVGRVRSQFLEFNDDYWHKPAPTDLIKYDRSHPHPHVRLYGFVGAGLWNRLRIIPKI